MIHWDELGLKALYQPEGDDPRTGYLLIVLHGRGDSPEGFEWFRSELAVPGLSALLLQAPDPYYTGYSWYDLPPNQLPGVRRSRALLERAFAEIHRQGFPPERCLLFGFSQGCLMTLEFGSRYSRRLAGYVGVSGYCYDPDALLQEASSEAWTGKWLITHGTGDEVLDVETTREQMRQLIAAGFPIDYREYAKGHTVDPRRELGEIRAWIHERMA